MNFCSTENIVQCEICIFSGFSDSVLWMMTLQTNVCSTAARPAPALCPGLLWPHCTFPMKTMPLIFSYFSPRWTYHHRGWGFSCGTPNPLGCSPAAAQRRHPPMGCTPAAAQVASTGWGRCPGFVWRPALFTSFVTRPLCAGSVSRVPPPQCAHRARHVLPGDNK